jgi:hypothetical protein
MYAQDYDGLMMSVRTIGTVFGGSQRCLGAGCWRPFDYAVDRQLQPYLKNEHVGRCPSDFNYPHRQRRGPAWAEADLATSYPFNSLNAGRNPDLRAPDSTDICGDRSHLGKDPSSTILFWEAWFWHLNENNQDPTAWQTGKGSARRNYVLANGRARYAVSEAQTCQYLW